MIQKLFERLLKYFILVFERSVKYNFYMARPKLHKRDETLKKAADFFWKNGFSGGSTRELGQALDMHPGSIYSAFGSKEGLCLEALDFYGQQSHQKFVAHMDESGFFEGLRGFLRDLVSEHENPSTCFVVKTLSSKLECEQNLVCRAKQLLAQFREEMRDRIVAAQATGEIAAEVDPSAFAALVQVQLMGVRSLADATSGSLDMAQVVDDAVELLRLKSRAG